MGDPGAAVVLHAVGNGEIGIGHLARTAALAEALLAQRRWKSVTLLWQCDAATAERFRPAEADCVLADDRAAMQTLFGESARRRRPALLVSDVFEPPPDYFAVARRLGFVAVAHLNDSGVTRAEADLLVDSDAFKSSGDAPPGFRGEALVGAPYQILRDQVARRHPTQPWSAGRATLVLIALSGADPDGLTVRLVRACLPRLASAQLSLTVVIGPEFSSEHRQELRELPTAGAPVELIGTPSDLATLILRTDLTVCLGGITAYETMCLGRPCAALSWEHLTPYVERLSAAGLLANLGRVDQLERAAEAFVALAGDGARLEQLARSGWEKIDGRGAWRVADRMATLMQRKAGRE
jgi:spore coat polysaccharide biosynthesis predicted glycosyltransferase SpsG